MRDDEVLGEFGRRIRGTRLEAGLSQEELAHRVGLHRTYIGSVERGERNIGLLNIAALATVLQVDASTFVTGLRRSSAGPRA
ncbi:helix-turn-helix transcriptional regulator [Dietzia sp. PP-33]|uniref:helix-turn-helix domain-containing protein n=1 Tax=Dietzia sp. PP-33 TaxID=2957500 RepID=UPI0029B62758|nr:helix-turn-helix transcriptional regulator [Dietzia sp. PP-33]MDX2358936.1 helix-turn-helix domain-containing protein [Dietzia sp. PP-33]